MGDLPPSSSVTRFIVAAPSRMMLSPTPTEPVKEILATSGIAYEFGADDLAEAGDDVQETVREFSLVQSLDQHPCLQRAHLAWLDDDGATRGDGGSELEANEQHVRIPSRDQDRLRRQAPG